MNSTHSVYKSRKHNQRKLDTRSIPYDFSTLKFIVLRADWVIKIFLMQVSDYCKKKKNQVPSLRWEEGRSINKHLKAAGSMSRTPVEAQRKHHLPCAPRPGLWRGGMAYSGLAGCIGGGRGDGGSRKSGPGGGNSVSKCGGKTAWGLHTGDAGGKTRGLSY